MTKVLIVGDTHSDASFISKIHKAAKADDIKTIVQLGDFGYNFDTNVMASIEAWLIRDPDHRWYWVDGNHDQHDYLDALVSLAGWEDPVPMSRLPWPRYKAKGWQEFPDRLFYCPRGSTWTLGSTVCMALGGAYSIDKYRRKQGVSWWYQELITEADLHKVEEVMQEREEAIDVMFTHDAPITFPFEDDLIKDGYKIGHESRANRMAMSAAVDMVKPKFLYHGHYHHRYTGEYRHMDNTGTYTMVEGIGANVYVPRGCDGDAVLGWNYVIREF